MTTKLIREKFIEFFKERGHSNVPPSSLVPVGDPSVLFTTAGMQQFKPYYIDPKSAPAARACSIQPIIRTNDIEEVGDNRHLTMFEMLGNFSFGFIQNQEESINSSTAYFKKTAIALAYQFLNQELAIDRQRMWVTVYEGRPELNIPADQESADIWQSLGLTEGQIKFEGEDNFWGPTGAEGPCGPTTEIYVDGIEVWNIVFNQFYSNPDKTLSPLEYIGVDTGAGLERLAVVLQNKQTVSQTDLFAPIVTKVKQLANQDKVDDRSCLIIIDHLKASLFLIADGVRPSNKAAGYVLRRLIRRALIKAEQIGLTKNQLTPIIEEIYRTYVPFYDRLSAEYGLTQVVLAEEIEKFERTLKIGLKEFEKIKNNAKCQVFPTTGAFKLFDTYGFPIELTAELADKAGYSLNQSEFEQLLKKHQELSRAGSDQIFKGGLADEEPATIRHHTAHHLLLAALRQELGESVVQRGSNVNSQRLRIDFAYPEKLTPEQLQKVETTVNKAIDDNLTVERAEMPREEALRLGALAEFGAKYGDIVSVYTIYNKDGSVFSRELCGGPHVKNTGELNNFKILKEESSSSGVRRIKAVTNQDR